MCVYFLLTLSAPPLFVDSSISLTTIEGQEVILPCATIPDPTLSFTWSFNDDLISLPTDEEDGPVLLTNGSLYFSSVADSREGEYTCEASNNLGTAEGTVLLTVLGTLSFVCVCVHSHTVRSYFIDLHNAVPPSLTPSPSSVTVTEGETALLTCEVTGDPTPILSWYHMGTLLEGESGTSLRLEGVEREEEGEYECVASNPAGDDRATVTLVVHSESLDTKTHK